MTTRQEQTVRRQALPMLRRDRRIVITVQVRSRSELIGWIRVLVSPSPNLTENIHLSRWTHPGWMNHSPGWKLTVTKPKQPSETQEKDSGKKKEDAKKKVLQDKLHRWIEARVTSGSGWLPRRSEVPYGTLGGMLVIFTMGIVAIADWGRRYLDKGLKYPIPTIPLYLFTPLPESHQSGAQVPVKPSQLAGPGGDVCHHSLESWKWLVTVLQFWTDEATVTDGAVYRGCVRPASALAEYVMDTVNPGLEPGCLSILGGRDHQDSMDV